MLLYVSWILDNVILSLLKTLSSINPPVKFRKLTDLSMLTLKSEEEELAPAKQVELTDEGNFHVNNEEAFKKTQ